MTDRHAIAMRPRPKVKRPAEQVATLAVCPFRVIERVLLDTSRSKDDRINYALQIAREAMKGEKA